MAEYTYTVPVSLDNEVGYSLDRVSILSDGTIEVFIAVKNSSNQTIRNIGPLKLKADANGTNAVLGASARSAIRTFVWDRLPNTFSAAQLPAPPSGTGA